MGCSYHIANATKDFCKVLEDKFNINNFLIDLCFHFDWPSKRKSILEEFFFDKKYSNIVTSHSVWWFGLSECLRRALTLFPSVNSSTLSQDPEIKS